MAAAGTAELAAIDPAALSARIAGMMMVRPMRMIPPCIYRGHLVSRDLELLPGALSYWLISTMSNVLTLRKRLIT